MGSPLALAPHVICDRCEVLENVAALLIDLDGVLYVEEEPIPGAVEAVERLRRAGLPLRFVTDTTAHSRDGTLEKLARLGVSVVPCELVTPRRSPWRTAASAGTSASR